MQAGTTVTYADANLHDYRGIIVTMGRTTHGGNCTVAWTRPILVRAEEYLENLMAEGTDRSGGHAPKRHGETEEEHECCEICCAAGRSLPGHYRCTPQETCGLWQPDYVGGCRPQDL